MRTLTAACFLSVLSLAPPQVQSALVYKDNITVPGEDQVWVAQTTGTSPSEGNGVTFTPDGEVIIVTKSDGEIVGYDPASTGTGDVLWNFDPKNLENVTSATCKSSVSFPGDMKEKYLVYAITATSNDGKDYGVVVAVDYSKAGATRRWHTAFGDLGTVEGTPKASYNGTEVYLTHNNDIGSVGTFTVLDASNNGVILYSEPNEPNANNETSAYGELGIYHQPGDGWYTGGEDNTEDIVIWSNKLTLNGAGGIDPTAGGGIFAFQFPADGSKNATEFAVTSLGEPKWKTSTAPIIFQKGRGLCFVVSQSQIRCWHPSNLSNPDRAPKNYFSAGASGSADLLPRSQPLGYQEPRSTPVVSGDGLKVYSGGASTSFYGFNIDYEGKGAGHLVAMFNHTDVGMPLWSSAVLGVDEERIFYVTEAGRIVCADPMNGNIYWKYDPLAPSESKAHFTLSPDGTQLVGSADVTDAGGFVSSIAIATIVKDTEAPSSAPTSTSQPSMMPSQMPSSVPSAKPSTSAPPSAGPSDTPSPTTSSMPSSQPSAVPSMEPSKPPTSHPSSGPSQAPSAMPGDRTEMPSDMPSSKPTSNPTSNPTSQPTSAPSLMPSPAPSAQTAPTSSASRTEQFGFLGMISAMVVGITFISLH